MNAAASPPAGTAPAQARHTIGMRRWRRRQRLQTEDMAHFARQLTTLLQAGLPLLQALHLMARGRGPDPMRRLLRGLARDIESGHSLSQALHAQGDFEAIFCNLVAAGESGGQLDEMLARLALHLDKSLSLRRALRSALVYPCAVLLVGATVTTLLLIAVVPAFEGIFQALGAPLPWLTQWVLDASRGLQQHGPLLLLGATVGLGLWQRWRQTPAGQRAWDRQRLRWPIWRTLTRHAEAARWCRTLSTLLSAGVAIHEALDSTAEVLSHRAYRRACRHIRQQLTQGQALSDSLARYPALFDPLLVQLCAVGEESGTLDTMLARMAEHHEQQVDDQVSRLATLLEPAIMLLLGVMLGTLVMAMYWPMFQLGQVL